MAGHLSYEPIYPGETYSITAFFKEGVNGTATLITDNQSTLVDPAEQSILNKQATWNLKGEEGKRMLTITSGATEQKKEVLITKEMTSSEALTLYAHSDLEKIQINYKSLKPLGELSIFGWHPGWVGIYIILSMIFSLGLRKVFKLY
jgi:hypothetical protein